MVRCRRCCSVVVVTPPAWRSIRPSRPASIRSRPGRACSAREPGIRRAAGVLRRLVPIRARRATWRSVSRSSPPDLRGDDEGGGGSAGRGAHCGAGSSSRGLRDGLARGRQAGRGASVLVLRVLDLRLRSMPSSAIAAIRGLDPRHRSRRSLAARAPVSGRRLRGNCRRPTGRACFTRSDRCRRPRSPPRVLDFGAATVGSRITFRRMVRFGGKSPSTSCRGRQLLFDVRLYPTGGGSRSRIARSSSLQRRRAAPLRQP